MMINIPQPPRIQLSITEFPRATLESWRLGWKFRHVAKSVPRGHGEPVICISGYGAGDVSMLPLRGFLQYIGYRPIKAEIGRNRETRQERIKSIEDALSFRDRMVQLLKQRVEEVYAREQQKVTLIGWSMGGLFAFDVSQLVPDKVRMVITLGSPFGDPRGTATFKLFRMLHRSDVPVEVQDFDSWNSRGHLRSGDVAIKVLYSKSDGIVAEEVARLHQHPAVEHIETGSSHVGFAVNPDVYAVIGRLLVS